MSTLPTQDLRNYLSELPRGGVAALASKLGIFPVYLSQLAARQDGRQPSPRLCVQIEAETGVSRRALRPHDWWLIWPELVTEQFPVPTVAEQA